MVSSEFDFELNKLYKFLGEDNDEMEKSLK